jgi:hypothetical protein
MKIIPGQKINSVTAGSEDAAYPDDNAIDEHPKKLWKAASGTYTTTLTLDISAGSSGLAVFNTNAVSISATVTDPNYFEWYASDIVWDSGDIEWIAEQASLSNELYHLDGVSGAAWMEWAYSSIPVTAVLTLTAGSTETVQAGVVVADMIREYECPQIGVTEGMKSYSIVRELQNGAFYRKERDNVRTFSFQHIEKRKVEGEQTDSAFYEYMYTFAKAQGFRPAAWMLAEMDDFWWVVYARFQQMPSGNHAMPDYSRLNTNLIEVL